MSRKFHGKNAIINTRTGTITLSWHVSPFHFKLLSSLHFKTFKWEKHVKKTKNSLLSDPLHIKPLK